MIVKEIVDQHKSDVKASGKLSTLWWSCGVFFGLFAVFGRGLALMVAVMLS